MPLTPINERIYSSESPQQLLVPRVFSRLFAWTSPAGTTSCLLVPPTRAMLPFWNGSCLLHLRISHSLSCLPGNALFRSVPTRHVTLTLSLNIVSVTVLLVTKYLARNGVRNWGELTFEGAVPRAGEDNEIRTALSRSGSREGNIWLSVFPFFFCSAGTPADRTCRYSQVFPTSVKSSLEKPSQSQPNCILAMPKVCINGLFLGRPLWQQQAAGRLLISLT